VFATFAAIWFLGERVSAVRWMGVALIVIGAAFISYSQQTKEKPATLPASRSDAVTR
jgi:drug/metabolite transporter (DMT)-like permease